MLRASLAASAMNKSSLDLRPGFDILGLLCYSEILFVVSGSVPMDKVSYSEAKASGLASYFTGVPCKHGHVAMRRTVNRACRECDAIKAKLRYDTKLAHDETYLSRARERAAKWAADNPEKYRANQKQWRQGHAKEYRAYNIQWRKDNREQIKQRKAEKRKAFPHIEKQSHKRKYSNPVYASAAKARAKVWRKKNKTRYIQLNLKWRRENPERAKSIARAGSINRRAIERNVGKISASDVRFIRAKRQCAACGQINARMEIDHIVALSRGGTNHRSNLQLLCRPCNRSKWANDAETWAREKGYIS
jgi:5-methylcytosine-specific restriction endonuclease McrA